MDIGLLIFFMIVLYVVPELLKRFKTKRTYEYPEFPTQKPGGPVGMPGTLSQGMKPPPVPAAAALDEGKTGDGGDMAWGTQINIPLLANLESASQTGSFELDTRNAMQGVVWAEIIAPPVSLRRRSYGRRRL